MTHEQFLKILGTRAATQEEMLEAIERGYALVEMADGNYWDRDRHGLESLDNLFRSETRVVLPKPRPEPPSAAAFLVNLFCKRSYAEGILGDLHEEFVQDCERYSPRWAAWQYWAGVGRSLLPLLARKLKKAGLIVVLIDYGRSKLGF